MSRPGHEKLRQAREGSRLTQRELGQILGISERAVRHFETGERSASDERVASWAIATGYPLAWFYREGVAA